MAEKEIDTDVLIAGAGPVGLFLANECARRGLRCRLIEKCAGQSEYSKALAVFPRTLEIFDMAGIAAPFLEAANRVTSVAFVARRKPISHVTFEPEGTLYPFVAMVPQDVTEKILVDELCQKGGTVEYETALVSAVEMDGRIIATLDRKGEQFQTTAQFLVGCDGAHSVVRHLLNLPFEGAQYQASFMLADVETNDVLPGQEMHLCTSESGPLAIFPMSKTRRRIVATLERPEDDAPSLEFVRTVIAQRAPEGFEARSLHRSSYFRIHHRQVSRMNVGRIFIAGDAAHIHSPFGGQGMNTGLQDAWNLVWKLDLAVRGFGNAQLLDSYSAERCPVIKGVIDTTDLLTKALGSAGKLVQAVRNAVIPVVSEWSLFQKRFVQNLSELSLAYSGSPIVQGSGKRFWDDSLRGGKGIESRFLLLIGSGAHSATQQEATLFCETFADLVELRHAKRSGIALVRPDGYIAYEGEDAGTALDSIRSLLRLQTN
jgi:2-polyprenyl-6-methoxyphenol hydroxylase-like FAD-dependent oxidoreductase